MTALIDVEPVAEGISRETERETGQRWYLIDQPDGTVLRLLSVTTAFKAIAKIGLDKWMTGYTADAAFVYLPKIVTASRKKPCERTRHVCRTHDWRDCPDKGCGVCRECVSAWIADRHRAHTERRSDEGKRVHNVIEWWTLHNEIKPHDEDIAPYVAAFQGFAAEYGITPESFLLAEATCYHPDAGYAGTTDGVVRVDAARTPAAAKLVARVLRANGEYAHLKTSAAIQRAVVKDERSVTLVLDWKTREKTREQSAVAFYSDQAMQVTGYRRCPIVRLKDSDKDVPMPATDGAIVVQLRPDGADVRLAVTNDNTYDAFLHALGLYRWLVGEGKQSMAVNSHPLGRKDEPASAGDDTPATEPDPFDLIAAAPVGAGDGIPF